MRSFRSERVPRKRYDYGEGRALPFEPGPREDHMKKTVTMTLATLLAVGALCLAGCGSKTGVSLTSEGGKVRVETEKGKVEIDRKAPSEADLGVPVYPGAESVRNSSGSYSEDNESITVSQFVTSDPVSAVLAWYREKLNGKPQFMDMSAPEGGLMTFQDGEQVKMVTIGPGSADQKGKTVIVIGSGTGSVPTIPK